MAIVTVYLCSRHLPQKHTLLSPTSPRRCPNDAVMVRGGIYYLTLGLSIARALLVTASALLLALTCLCSSATVVQPYQVRHVLSLSLLRPELDDGPLHPLVVAHVTEYSFSDPKSQFRRSRASHLEEGVGLGTDPTAPKGQGQLDHGALLCHCLSTSTSTSTSILVGGGIVGVQTV